MLTQPHLAHNMPLIVTALQCDATDIVRISISPERDAISGPIHHPCDDADSFIICYSDTGDGESFDDTNDALAQLLFADYACAVYVRDNPNDVKRCVIIYSREPITCTILHGCGA